MVREFLGRLRQRRLFRVAALYAATGYAVVQIANNLFPALHLPEWSVSLIASLFLLGFPVVLVMAHAVAPVDAAAVAEGKVAAPARPGWFDWCLGAAVLVVIAFAVATAFLPRHAPATGAVPVADGAAPDKSIAVLPFVNFSDARDADYFADGLTEELINGLAQLPDLRVAGRTSAFYFKGRNEDLREIGRKLGVAHVLEGSVRRSGDTLRITAQLIKVADGFHVWSQTYDRPSSDAFLIQSQIATAVAQVLKARLLGDGPAVPAPAPRDARAYQTELVARSHLRKAELPELTTARKMFEDLTLLEPDNARAYVGYAEATLLLAQNFLALDFDAARRQGQAAIERALRIAPSLADAWRVQGLIERVIAIRSGDQSHAATALVSFRRAVQLEPRNSDAIAMLAGQLQTNGQGVESITLLRQALQIDPLSRTAQQLLGKALVARGEFAEARRVYESLIGLYPEFTSARVALGQMLVEQGHLDEAVIALDDPALIRADPLAGLVIAQCYANLGMDAELATLLEGVREPAAAAAVAHAVLLQRRMQRSELAQFAERQSRETRDPMWRQIGIMTTVLSDDVGAMRLRLSDLPQSLKAVPAVTGPYSPIDTLLYAWILRRTGDAESADRIVAALLQTHDAPAGAFRPVEDLWIRILAQASIGDVEGTIAELRHASAQGYRTLVDFEYFVRLEQYPFVAQVAKDPRFREIVASIEKDNARMREALRARRAPSVRAATAVR